MITLGAGDLRSLLRELDERLSSTASFFRGGRVALHVGTRDLNTEDLEALEPFVPLSSIPERVQCGRRIDEPGRVWKEAAEG